MDTLGTRQVMETTSFETANQYIRFGWKLLNQYVIPATEETPARVNYVLASIRSLEDTKHLLLLDELEQVNAHLAVGWRLIEKFVTEPAEGPRREVAKFVLAWQTPDPPMYPRAIQPDDGELELESSADP